MRAYSSNLTRIWQPTGAGTSARPQVCGPHAKAPVYAVAVLLDAAHALPLHVCRPSPMPA